MLTITTPAPVLATTHQVLVGIFDTIIVVLQFVGLGDMLRGLKIQKLLRLMRVLRILRLLRSMKVRVCPVGARP